MRMIKAVTLAICLAIGVSAQTPDDLKRQQERITSELQNAKKESEALRREVAEAQARNNSRFAALKKESETEIGARAAETARANEALVECQASLAARDRELAAIKKNIKRRALLRILTFQW